MIGWALGRWNNRLPDPLKPRQKAATVPSPVALAAASTVALYISSRAGISGIKRQAGWHSTGRRREHLSGPRAPAPVELSRNRNRPHIPGSIVTAHRTERTSPRL